MSMVLAVEALPVPLAAWGDGTMRVGRTRVTLDSVMAAFLAGATPEEIVTMYDTLELGDVYMVIAYYLRHRDEVDAYIEERRRHRADVRHALEARHDPTGIKERLLARRASDHGAP
jgi:uncharacterized protein (DUF433 family)